MVFENHKNSAFQKVVPMFDRKIDGQELVIESRVLGLCIRHFLGKENNRVPIDFPTPFKLALDCSVGSIDRDIGGWHWPELPRTW